MISPEIGLIILAAVVFIVFAIASVLAIIFITLQPATRTKADFRTVPSDIYDRCKGTKTKEGGPSRVVVCMTDHDSIPHMLEFNDNTLKSALLLGVPVIVAGLVAILAYLIAY